MDKEKFSQWIIDCLSKTPCSIFRCETINISATWNKSNGKNKNLHGAYFEYFRNEKEYATVFLTRKYLEDTINFNCTEKKYDHEKLRKLMDKIEEKLNNGGNHTFPS